MTSNLYGIDLFKITWKNLYMSRKNGNFAGNLKIIKHKENEYFLQMA